MLNSNFIAGFITGVVFISILGWLFMLWQGWAEQRNAVNRKQIVIQTTRDTPADVARQASAAGCRMRLVQLAILFILILLFSIRFPDMAQQISRALIRFINNIL